jgi:hypothetical protein
VDQFDYIIVTASGTHAILIPRRIMLVVIGLILDTLIIEVSTVLTIVPIKRFLQGITGLRSTTKQKSKHHGCSTQ